MYKDRRCRILTVVAGLKDTGIGEAIILTDKAANILMIGNNLGISSRSKVVLVLVVYVQADLFSSNP